MTAESPRVGVLYSDGSINVMATFGGDAAALKRARDEIKRANLNERRPLHLARLVSLDLERGDVVELTEGDLE